MARNADPTWVTTGKRGKGIGLQFPVVHPPACICKEVCLDPAKRPLESRSGEFVVRVRRQAKAKTQNGAIAEAQRLKEEMEASLVAAVADAKERNVAVGGSKTLREIADSYAAHQKKEGKRYDRDRYVIAEIVAHFGEDRDPTTITKRDYLEWCGAMEKRGRADATIQRRTTTLLAILNRARRWELIPHHRLDGIEKPKPILGKPVTYSPRQIVTLLGPAMDRYEAEQELARAAYDPDTHQKAPSVVPLRGIVMIGLYTLIRPSNNLALRWEDVVLHPREDRGSFHLRRHKNAKKGIVAEGALHPDLVRYFRSIRPARAAGLIHPNPATGRAYVNIRTQWRRLVVIANEMLDTEEQIKDRAEDMYVLRATGASLLAACGADPVLICNMMGDQQLETIRRHYFASHLDHMQAAVNRLVIGLS